MVVGHQDKFAIVQTQHRLVDQDLGKLVIDKTQHRLVDQVQDKFGIVGIYVAGIVAVMVIDLMVIAHQYKFDQVVNNSNQYKSESFQ